MRISRLRRSEPGGAFLRIDRIGVLVELVVGRCSVDLLLAAGTLLVSRKLVVRFSSIWAPFMFASD